MFVKLLTIIVFFVILLSQLQKSSSQFLANFSTYNGFHPPFDLISLQGIASVTPRGLLELTNSTSHQTGHAFYTRPIRFKDTPNDTVSSFSTTFVFAIHSQIPTLGGDGIAFVVAPTSSLPFARSGQYLGLFNLVNNGNETNNIFAVELDTIQNNEFNDTNDNHVGIDINSLKSVKSSPAGYWDEKGQFKDLTLISGKPMQVWVDYNGRTNQINVTIAPFRKDKPTKPLVSTVRDLSPVLLQDMFVGFSSSTGLIKTKHVVLGWSFRVKGKAPQLALQRLPKIQEPQPTTSGISPFTSVFIPVSVPIIVFIFSVIFLVRFILRRRRKFLEKLEDWETEFMKN
ncbi:L-type lectin-domain containing receptor kinase IV.1 [Raphanus sativus]|uniref:non-specific serine/threonine protein kinase n=1 Tax=Raphanus sativus TaxID=3726 RepID=A0A9W3CH81_RAPSA|nr:L-type lectin-domain containing receptor kinase IV.1-like [Raphanus sativus]KAJ4876590.1 L-type lectin-domain containing receptor kinase IV.1 [Raphanus sativus]